MDDERDSLHKSSSQERRLRLRKECKESIDEKARGSDNSNSENKKSHTTSNISQSAYEDDSILDFKSPKKVHFVQPRIVDSHKPPHKSSKRKQPLHSKTKVNKEKKADSGGKPLQSKKVVRDVQQPLIESSFFKSDKETNSPQSSADVKVAHVCPLCFKTLKDENSQAVHMKSCAIRNNVSTKKLMVAVELQERQAAERKSLGLLSAPVLQEKKKPVPRKMTSHDDPDLQLALALSKSLYEKEEMENWDEVQIVAISSSPSSLPDTNTESCQKTTLQSFGFTSSRNISPVNNWPATRNKRKKLTEPTILQRRTAIERECILTERIAEILMDGKDFTQRLQDEGDQVNDVRKKIVIQSQLLQQICRTGDTLWDRTKLTPTKNIFYVKQLSPQITPMEKKEQIVDEEQNIKKLMNPTADDKKLFDNKQETETQTAQVTSNEELEKRNFSSGVGKCCRETELLGNLASSWRNMLNDSCASDVIVLVRNGRHIWAHKLVFYARCANILLDVTTNDTEFSSAKEKLCWADYVDYDVALAFLEFVYCGIIDRYAKTLDSDGSLREIRSLARRYKVNDLFVYLHRREFASNAAAEIKSHERDDEPVNVPRCPLETLSREANICADLLSVEDTKNSRLLQQNEVDSTKSEERNSRSGASSPFWERSASPDMFDDTIKHDDKSAIGSTVDQEDSNLRALLSLIKQDVDICASQNLRSSSKSRDTGSSESGGEDAFVRENAETHDVIMEIDSDSRESLVKEENSRKNSSIGTSRSGEPMSAAADAANRKGDITLFIEKVRRENARSDSDLDVEHSVLSPLRHKNPFLVDRCDSDDSPRFRNTADNGKKKLGRLSEMEQRARSYVEKNPEFYSRLSGREIVVERSTVSLETDVSPERTTDNTSSRSVRVSASPVEDGDTSREMTADETSAARSSWTPANRSSDETVVCDSEADDRDISMYSRYMRNRGDNSIAKYRAAIRRSASAGDVSREIASFGMIIKTRDENRQKPPLSEEDTDVIVSSDTEIESVSSGISSPVVAKNDNRENSASQSGKIIENSGKSVISEEKSHLPESEEIAKVTTTDLEKEGDINDATRSSKDAFNDIEVASDNTDFGAIFTQSKLNYDNQKAESVPSPIMVPSSPDALSIENLLSDAEYCRSQDIPKRTGSPKVRKSADFSLIFEDDIYLANVDVNRYEKHVLEKSRSAGVLNVATKFTERNNAHRRDCRNGIISSDATTDTCGSSKDAAAASSTRDLASIRNFRKKSLSEGQISVSRLCGQGIAEHVRIRYSSQSIGNAKAASKVTEKDVTPPPDYNGMGTPELHKEMKKYGLKAQKRGRAVKLLTHIYNELHPLIPKTIARQEITEISSDEDDGPPAKKRNVNDDDNAEKSNDAEDASDDELLCSQESNGSLNSVKAAISKEMEFYETESSSSSPLGNSSDISEVFTRLIESDRDLYNKILRYEPVNIESLHQTLRARGFKCKLPNLMSFLDEQCITFYVPEQNVRNRTRKR